HVRGVRSDALRCGPQVRKRHRLAELLRSARGRHRHAHRSRLRHDAHGSALQPLRRPSRSRLRGRPAADGIAGLYQRHRAEFRTADVAQSQYVGRGFSRAGTGRTEVRPYERMPPAPMRIATTDDADALAQLINQAFAVEMFFKRGDRTSPDDVRSLMRDGKFFVHDREDGSPAAVVFLRVGTWRRYFGMLSVAPDLQGRGLAPQIIAEVEERLRQAGCDTLAIYVVNLPTELPPSHT